MSAAAVERIVILGGGTAGWMTAAALSKALERTPCRITLIESAAIGTIGVGEATIPTIHWFNQLVGIDEAELLRETKATYKLGIEFDGWNGAGSRYFHPFGTYGGPGDGVMFVHRLIRARLGGLGRPIDDYSLMATAARAARFARPSPDPRSPLSTAGYAYHFDAGLYAAYLRRLAERRSVRRIEGKVVAVDQHPETGFVRSLATESGDTIEGNLFIDCSGQRGVLIEQTLGAGFDDWGEWLPCDRAWTAPTAPEETVTPFTRATAAEAGWRWRIPLQHRVGNGYVFSSRFQDEDAARASLLAGLEEPPTAEPRLIRFAIGRRKRAWLNNVVAIGLAAGFIEPLESTGIHLIQSGIAKLLSLFPRADCDPLVAEQFDRAFAAEIDGIRDFLALHYHFTQGRSEPLWQHCRQTAPPATLATRIEQFRRSGRIVLGENDLFRDASWFAVMIGQGIEPADYNPLLDAVPAADNLRQVEAVRETIARTSAALPPLRRG